MWWVLRLEGLDLGLLLAYHAQKTILHFSISISILPALHLHVDDSPLAFPARFLALGVALPSLVRADVLDLLAMH